MTMYLAIVGAAVLAGAAVFGYLGGYLYQLLQLNKVLKRTPIPTDDD